MYFFSWRPVRISIPCTGFGYFIEQIYQHFKNIYFKCWTVACSHRTYFIRPHYSYILSRALLSANNCTSFYFLAVPYHKPSADILAWTWLLLQWLMRVTAEALQMRLSMGSNSGWAQGDFRCYEINSVTPLREISSEKVWLLSRILHVFLITGPLIASSHHTAPIGRNHDPAIRTKDCKSPSDY